MSLATETDAEAELAQKMQAHMDRVREQYEQLRLRDQEREFEIARQLAAEREKMLQEARLRQEEQIRTQELELQQKEQRQQEIKQQMRQKKMSCAKRIDSQFGGIPSGMKMDVGPGSATYRFFNDTSGGVFMNFTKSKESLMNDLEKAKQFTRNKLRNLRAEAKSEAIKNINKMKELSNEQKQCEEDFENKIKDANVFQKIALNRKHKEKMKSFLRRKKELEEENTKYLNDMENKFKMFELRLKDIDDEGIQTDKDGKFYNNALQNLADDLNVPIINPGENEDDLREFINLNKDKENLEKEIASQKMAISRIKEDLPFVRAHNDLYKFKVNDFNRTTYGMCAKRNLEILETITDKNLRNETIHAMYNDLHNQAVSFHNDMMDRVNDFHRRREHVKEVLDKTTINKKDVEEELKSLKNKIIEKDGDLSKAEQAEKKENLRLYKFNEKVLQELNEQLSETYNVSNAMVKEWEDLQDIKTSRAAKITGIKEAVMVMETATGEKIENLQENFQQMLQPLGGEFSPPHTEEEFEEKTPDNFPLRKLSDTDSDPQGSPPAEMTAAKKELRTEMTSEGSKRDGQTKSFDLVIEGVTQLQPPAVSEENEQDPRIEIIATETADTGTDLPSTETTFDHDTDDKASKTATKFKVNMKFNLPKRGKIVHSETMSSVFETAETETDKVVKPLKRGRGRPHKETAEEKGSVVTSTEGTSKTYTAETENIKKSEEVLEEKLPEATLKRTGSRTRRRRRGRGWSRKKKSTYVPTTITSKDDNPTECEEETGKDIVSATPVEEKIASSTRKLSLNRPRDKTAVKIDDKKEVTSPRLLPPVSVPSQIETDEIDFLNRSLENITIEEIEFEEAGLDEDFDRISLAEDSQADLMNLDDIHNAESASLMAEEIEMFSSGPDPISASVLSEAVEEFSSDSDIIPPTPTAHIESFTSSFALPESTKSEGKTFHHLKSAKKLFDTNLEKKTVDTSDTSISHMTSTATTSRKNLSSILKKPSEHKTKDAPTPTVAVMGEKEETSKKTLSSMLKAKSKDPRKEAATVPTGLKASKAAKVTKSSSDDDFKEAHTFEKTKEKSTAKTDASRTKSISSSMLKTTSKDTRKEVTKVATAGLKVSKASSDDDFKETHTLRKKEKETSKKKKTQR